MSTTESAMDMQAQQGISASGDGWPVRADAWPMPRRQLVKALALFVLLSGILVASMLGHMYQREIESGRQLTAAMAQLIEEQTSRTFQSLDRQLQTVQRELQLMEQSGRLKPQAGRDLLQLSFQGMPFVRASWITDERGIVVHDSLDASPHSDISDRPYFRIYQQQPGTGFYIGPPVRSRLTQQWLISASRPILSPQGALRGVIVVAVEPAYFDTLWGTAHQMLGGAIGLWRSDGTLTMRSPGADAAIGKTYPALPLFKQAGSASGTGSFSNRSPFDGESRMFAFRRLSAYPDFLVAVGQSKTMVTASWRHFALVSVVIWLVCCGALVLLGFFLERVWRQNQQSKDMLRLTSERLALATEAGAIGIFDWDMVSDLLHATPAYFSQIGQPVQTGPIGRCEWLERVHPDDRAIVDEDIRKAVGSGDPAYADEIRVLHADGNYRWMRVTGRVTARDPDGRPTRLLGTRIDITERKLREQQLIAAEQSLRAGEQRYRMLFEQSPAGIGITDSDTRISEANAELCDMLGYPREELVGMAFADLIAPHQRKQVDGALHALQTGQGNRREWLLQRKDGALLVVDVIATCMPDGRVMNLVHDVTQRKEDEQSLRGVLQEQEALLREVHHRVKNNLQVIHSMLRLEASRSQGGDARSVLLEMQARVQSIALLHGMLYRVGKFASVDLGGYLYQLSNQAMRAGHDQTSRIQLQLDLASVAVDMDQAMCCGLIVNELLSNCLKHGFPDGRDGEIRVALQLVGGGEQLRLCVSDDGIGLASSPLPPRPATMGMQLVADLAAQLEGQLEIDAGPGAEFCVTFARTRPRQSPLPDNARPRPEASASASAFNTMTEFR